MTNRQATGTKQDADRMVLSVPDAAQRLGVTPDAIRARLHRGTLEGEKQGGEWRVFLPAEPTAPIADTPATDQPELLPDSGKKSDSDRQDTKQDATGKQSSSTGVRQDADSPLIAAIVAAKDETISRLADEVVFLRHQLDQRSRELADERERSDVLHREAFARIEAITAGMAPINHDDDDQTAPESPQIAQDAPGATRAPSPNDESNAEPVSGHGTRFARWWANLFRG
jgi:hypothetical protein